MLMLKKKLRTNCFKNICCIPKYYYYLQFYDGQYLLFNQLTYSILIFEISCIRRNNVFRLVFVPKFLYLSFYYL